MTNNCYQKTKKSFKKKHAKGTKIFLKKKKTKSVNMLVSDVEVFLKKKKKRSVNGRERYKNLLEDEYNFFFQNATNKDYLSIKHFLFCLPLVHRVFQESKRSLLRVRFFEKIYQIFSEWVFLIFQAWARNCPRQVHIVFQESQRSLLRVRLFEKI